MVERCAREMHPLTACAAVPNLVIAPQLADQAPQLGNIQRDVVEAGNLQNGRWEYVHERHGKERA
jgi:hypothetical protein